ncbi:MAG: magnesium transporter [Bacillota bacterium]|nr:magnesium transporter [Bacillota bacterium]
MKNGEKSLAQIRALLTAQQASQILELFSALQPYDQAELVSMLAPEERWQVLHLLPDETLASIFEELDAELVAEIVEELEEERVSRVLCEMSSDDVVDLLAELEEEQAEELLELMEAEDAREVKSLLTYPENTAGRLMTNEYVTLKSDWTAEEALRRLRKEAPGAETIYYLYVTDNQEKLVGVVSLRELIVAAADTPIANIMSENVVFVSAEVDQEEAARLIERYDFLALPVVDENQRLVGIVTVDDVIDVLEDEATEDFSRLAAIEGITEVSDLRVPAYQAAFKRLPWLVLLMFFGFISGNIIARFEKTLEAVAILAIFIPLIADMAGNTGTQSLAVVVRGLAVTEFRPRDFLWLLRREAGVGLIIGTVSGLLIALLTYLWQGNIWLGFVLGFSLWLTLFVSTLSGAVVPLILNYFKIDPAVASGPFITTINDIIGLTIYFSVATAFISFLVP